MSLIVKARNGVVGLRLQKRSFNPAIASRRQPVHAAPIHKVGDQRGDEHRFARPGQPGHAQPDHRFKQRFADRVAHRLNPAQHRIRKTGDDHVFDLLSRFPCKICVVAA